MAETSVNLKIEAGIVTYLPQLHSQSPTPARPLRLIKAMRDLLLIAFIATSLLSAVRYPFVAVLLWGWFTLATPQQAAYFASQLPLNAGIAAAAFGILLVHGDLTRRWPSFIFFFMILFAGWIGISQGYSLNPGYSEEPADRFIKVIIFAALCALTVTDRLRFHALLWLFALVMGFYGAKGGFYTLLTLGKGIYYGQAQTILFDNNHMGIALAASLPIFLYLGHVTANRWVRRAIWAVAGLSLIAVIGTHSRGAFISLLAFGGLMWLRSDRKVLGVLAAGVLGIAGLQFVPDDWSTRMATIAEAGEDNSFRGRLEAWEINWLLAKENPITGAGMRVPYTEEAAAVVSSYEPRAAHSIYFEVLGGTGFVGLALYLGILAYGLHRAVAAEKKYAKVTTDRWRAL
ncbi:MAG: putative O-glycosylation ligase, exosortase A system-associated, partial [Pseudomonadota bacterium]